MGRSQSDHRRQSPCNKVLSCSGSRFPKMSRRPQRKTDLDGTCTKHARRNLQEDYGTGHKRKCQVDCTPANFSRCLRRKSAARNSDEACHRHDHGLHRAQHHGRSNQGFARSTHGGVHRRRSKVPKECLPRYLHGNARSGVRTVRLSIKKFFAAKTTDTSARTTGTVAGVTGDGRDARTG